MAVAAPRGTRRRPGAGSGAPSRSSSGCVVELAPPSIEQPAARDAAASAISARSDSTTAFCMKPSRARPRSRAASSASRRHPGDRGRPRLASSATQRRSKAFRSSPLDRAMAYGGRIGTQRLHARHDFAPSILNRSHPESASATAAGRPGRRTASARSAPTPARRARSGRAAAGKPVGAEGAHLVLERGEAADDATRGPARRARRPARRAATCRASRAPARTGTAASTCADHARAPCRRPG